MTEPTTDPTDTRGLVGAILDEEARRAEETTAEVVIPDDILFGTSQASLSLGEGVAPRGGAGSS